MTITLHCSHCNQSMAIAPRKPGSRVDCPSCGRSVVVPSADAADKPASPARENGPALAPSRAVDSPRGSADRAGAVATTLPPARTATAPAVASTATAAAGAATVPRNRNPKPALAEPEVPFLPQLTAASPLLRPAELSARTAVPEGVVLPKSVLILLILFALAALGCAFFAGFLFGKQSANETRAAAAVEAISNSVIFTSFDFSQPGAIPHDC